MDDRRQGWRVHPLARLPRLGLRPSRLAARGFYGGIWFRNRSLPPPAPIAKRPSQRRSWSFDSGSQYVDQRAAEKHRTSSALLYGCICSSPQFGARDDHVHYATRSVQTTSDAHPRAVSLTCYKCSRLSPKRRVKLLQGQKCPSTQSRRLMRISPTWLA